jgi:hypothetical protein
MLGIRGPEQISGLNLWFDAADRSSINDGKVTDRQNVYKFRDKISGVTLINGNGALGPSYSFGAINGKNAIHFPWFGTVQNDPAVNLDGAIKSLTASNVTQLGFATVSMFLVYKPTTTFYQNLNGNQKYTLSIWNDARIQGGNPGNGSGGGFPSRAIYVGDERDPLQGGTTTAAQRQNPSGRVVEGFLIDGGPGYRGQSTYTEHIHSRSLEGPISLNKVSITSARLQNGLKKIGFINENSESLEDLTIAVAKGSTMSLGPPRSPSPHSASMSYYRNRNYRIDGQTVDPTQNAWLVLGAWWPRSYLIQTTGGNYPYEGFICEFLHYNRYLTDQETDAVRQYLKNKWFPK